MKRMPAIPMYRILKQYADAHGFRFFTASEQNYVRQHYFFHAQFKNQLTDFPQNTAAPDLGDTPIE